MTIEEVKNTLPLNEMGDVHMEKYNCFIPVGDFVDRFNGADLTYNSLSSHANATSGWKDQFQQWQTDGVIS